MKTFLNSKSIVLLLSFTLFCGVGYAQDIITMKDSTKIEAKVLEINISDVKYKIFTHQNGPDYSILKSDISSILYANGTVEAFTETQNPDNESNSNSNCNCVNNSTKNSINDGTPVATSKFNQMSDRQQAAFLRQTDPEIFRKFHSGLKLQKTGKILRIVGLGVSGSGLGLIMIGSIMGDNGGYVEYAFYRSEYSDTQIVIAGIAFASVGLACVIASIPLSANGSAKKKSAQNDYINKYSSTGALEPTLNLNFHGNGIGVAINF
jgi:hypothetical protein